MERSLAAKPLQQTREAGQADNSGDDKQAVGQEAHHGDIQPGGQEVHNADIQRGLEDEIYRLRTDIEQQKSLVRISYKYKEVL